MTEQEIEGFLNRLELGTIQSKIRRDLIRCLGSEENVCNLLDKIKEDIKISFPFLIAGAAEQLNGYRRAIGEATWAGVAANPALPSLVDKWLQYFRKEAASMVVRRIRHHLPSDTTITDSDILRTFTTFG